MAKLTRKYQVFFLLGIYLILHSFLAWQGSHFDILRLPESFIFLDSVHYDYLAIQGYFPNIHPFNYAFFPLWPLILRAINAFLHNPTILSLVGGCVSAVLFGFVVFFSNRSDFSQHSKEQGGEIIYARTFLASALLIFSPGAWVFFSNHTEALFLFLSFFSFVYAIRAQYLWAAIFAGLCTLTRNQGVLVAITVALVPLFDRRFAMKLRVRKFILVSIVSFLFYALWLGFLYWQTGSIFASIDAQKHWKAPPPFREYIRNFLWLSPTNVQRAVIFWAILFCGGWLIVKKRKTNSFAIPVGFYLISSAALWPLQGNNFPQAFRFGAVLFPFWFILGNTLSDKFSTFRKPYGFVANVLVVGTMIAISATVSSYFFLKNGHQWPY